VISTGDTVSVSFLPPHSKPILQPKHKEVRSMGDNADRRSSAGTSIALDSATSIHLFGDRSPLDNIKVDDKKKMKVRTTDSTFHVNDIGELCASLKSLPLPPGGYYFYPKGVANILSLALLAKTKRVVMDTAIKNAFYVINEDGSYVKFVPSNNGMYCLDIGSNDDPHVMAIQTIKDEQSKFSNIDCTRAEGVQKLQEVLACPSDYDLANTVEHNILGNTPFTRRDVRIAKQIYGPDAAALKGKTVQQQSKLPREDEGNDIPCGVHLSIDIMHVNGISFLISFSKHIGMIQSYCIRKKNKQKYLDGILAMLRIYQSRHPLRVLTIKADGAFEAIHQELQDQPYQVALSTCDADQHVETIERQIRSVKEWIRSVQMMLPYKKLPKRFLIELVYRVTMLMNYLPKKGGSHHIISPRELITGKKLRVPEHHIGQYVQGHTGGTSDTCKERSVDPLYIGQADNGSGHVVFKLSTKQPVSVNRVTVITPTADHIKFVNDMAEAENQPEGLEFADINGKVTLEDFMDGIDDDDDDDSNASDDDFVHDKEYQKEFNEETRLEKNEGLAIDENHADAFSNDLEQLVQDPSDRPNLKNTRLRPRINGRVVALSHETEECGRKKKKNIAVRFDNDKPTGLKLGVDEEETSFYDALSDHTSEEESTNPTSNGSDPNPYSAMNSGVNTR
jgi:hypothetical protein